ARQRRLPLHIRERLRGPPGQGGGPHLGHGAGRLPVRRPLLPRGLRNAGHHQPHHPGRRDPRAGQRDAGEAGGTRPPSRAGDRLRPGGLLLAQRQGRVPPARPVARDRHGRGRLRQQGRGRRRPGHHVRLRLPRNAGADAGAALLCPRDPAPRPRHAPCRRRGGAGPAARRQIAGDAPLRGRQAGRLHLHRRLHPARGTAGPSRDQAHAAPDRGEPAPLRLDVPGRRVLCEPDGQVRDRRAGRRLRPDRAQDHRGHLRRRGPARRRRLLRQGPDQGGPLRRLRLPLPRQERGRGRAGGALHHPGLLRHRRVQAALGVFRPARHRPRRGRGEAGAGGERDGQPLAAWHPRTPPHEPPDLRPHLRLRPLRPHPRRVGRHLHLGEDRPGGGAEAGLPPL
ncbi:MAG: S-adenosylmethionine synthetase, partial [uncultured Acetobacteraceae bacterium]